VIRDFKLLSHLAVNTQSVEHLGVVAALQFCIWEVQVRILHQKPNIVRTVMEFLILTNGGIIP
jgi:hypothetical protein